MISICFVVIDVIKHYGTTYFHFLVFFILITEARTLIFIHIADHQSGNM